MRRIRAIIDPARTQRALRQRWAYTLVELLLALSLLSLIATTVASVLFGFSRGTEGRHDLRRRNATADVVCNRIEAAIRPCAMLLASGERFMVLWTADADGNGKPNLSELSRIEWDPSSGEIRAYRADGIAEADDAVNELTADFDTLTQDMKEAAEFPNSPIAANVRNWTIAEQPAPQSARLISFSLTLADGDGTWPVRSSAALRGQTPAGN